MHIFRPLKPIFAHAMPILVFCYFLGGEGGNCQNGHKWCCPPPGTHPLYSQTGPKQVKITPISTPRPIKYYLA